MLKFIEKLRAKPSDRNIRIIRGVFALILLGVLYLGFQKTHFEYVMIPKEALYALYIFPLIGLIRAIFDPGVFRKKIWKWTQVGLGVVMIFITLFLIETDTKVDTPVAQTASGSLSATALSTLPASDTTLDTDFWFGFLGFWLALAGLTLASKNITTKNERYGEKVTKIRV